MKCKFCHGEIEEKVTKCKYCGEWLSYKFFLQRKDLIVIPLIIFLFLGLKFFTNIMFLKSQRRFEMVDYKKGNKDLNISRVKEVQSSKRLYLVGEIENHSNKKYHGLSITALFYDKDKNVIDISSDFISSLGVKDQKNFKIEFICGECDDSFINKYDHYELEIESGYHYLDGH